MPADSELLRQYVEDGSETAFTSIVQCYSGLVYSAALRLVGGKEHLAKEVAQEVFIILIRKAPVLIEHETLAGWLHTTTRYVALRALRAGWRQAKHEQEAAAMQTNSASDMPWEQLCPLLDEAIGRLNEPDRQAVLLRYFQSQSHREVGAVLGLSEDTARVRTERAVEKLRRHFAKSGIITSTALLIEALTVNAAHAAPTSFVGEVTAASFAHAKGLGLGHALIKALYMATKTKIITAAAVIVALMAIPLFQQHQKIAQLTKQLAAAQHDGARSARGQNQATGQAGMAPPQLTQQEILAKIIAIKNGGGNLQKKWQAFIDALNPADIPKVRADLEQLFTHPDQTIFLGPLLALWAKSDPQAALAYMDKYPSGSYHDMEVEAVLEGWADKDPEAAAAWWQQLPAGQLRSDSAKTVIDALAEKDPKRAYEITLAANHQLQSSLIQDVFMSWAGTDPAAAVAQASQMSPGQLRDLAFRDLAMGWSQSDPEAAQAWAESLPEGPDKVIALTMTVQGLATKNPQEATDYVLNLPQGQERDDSIGYLTMVLAENDPNAAWTLAQQLPNGNAKQKAEVSIVNRWAESDPAGAITFLESLSSPLANSQRLLSGIASSWSQNAPQDAIAGAANLPEGPDRNSYLSGVFNGLLSSSPPDAANFVSSLPPDKQAAAEDRVTFSLAESNPAAAAAWMSSLPEGVTSAKAFDYVVSQWANYDPTAAGQWIETLPSETSQDAALQTYVGVLTKSYPAAAAAWAGAINDPMARNAAVEKVAQTWLGSDPKAAGAWLAQSGLPAERQQKLLNPKATGP